MRTSSTYQVSTTKGGTCIVKNAALSSARDAADGFSTSDDESVLSNGTGEQIGTKSCGISKQLYSQDKHRTGHNLEYQAKSKTIARQPR